MSYDLRRLRAHGLIDPHPAQPPLPLTDTGLHHAMLLTHVHNRCCRPAWPNSPTPTRPPSPLRAAARNYQHALDQLTQEAGLAA